MMKRIDQIANLEKMCVGCLACVDVCPVRCITSTVAKDGFVYSQIDEEKCIGCGKCYRVCPIDTAEKHQGQQHLFAAYARNLTTRNSGSSGGIFALLADHFAKKGYYICAAAFDGTVLKHHVLLPGEDLAPLLKSKYLQSNMEGIYARITELLARGEKVFFCGTPCQVSAVINTVPAGDRERLFTADIICHGVPSQKVFSDYIGQLEKKHRGTISEFSFRVKDNRYKHAHGYSYNVTRNGRTTTVNGIYTKSTFYNAFKNYLIFRKSCYRCQYATLERVSDITLADFWGIEKYNPRLDVDKGVSMILTNSEKGQRAFSTIFEMIEHEEYPIQYGIESNYCLTNATKEPRNRDTIIEEIACRGYVSAEKKYFSSGLIGRVYWWLPPSIRKLIRKLRVD